MVGPKNRDHNCNYSFRVVEINVWSKVLDKLMERLGCS